MTSRNNVSPPQTRTHTQDGADTHAGTQALPSLSLDREDWGARREGPPARTASDRSVMICISLPPFGKSDRSVKNSLINTLRVSSVTSEQINSKGDRISCSRYTISLHIIPVARWFHSCQQLLDPSPFQRPGPALGGDLSHCLKDTQAPRLRQ